MLAEYMQKNTKATYACMVGKLRWHCKRPLEQHFNVKKRAWYGRQMKYILMNNNA